MGKFFGSVLFFLVATVLVYYLNLPYAEYYAQLYWSYDSFAGVHVIAAFELLHHPFAYFWVLPSWFIAAALGGIICRSWKGALVVSILTGFILSLTWIFLMSRYIPTYWTFFLSSHTTLEFLGQTIGLGLLLGLLSAGPAVGGAYLIASRNKVLQHAPLKEIQTICPTCGTKFQSKPKICYKCNTLLEKTD